MKKENLIGKLFIILFLFCAGFFAYTISKGADNSTISAFLSLFSFLMILYSMFQAELKQKDIKTILVRLDEIKAILERKEP